MTTTPEATTETAETECLQAQVEDLYKIITALQQRVEWLRNDPQTENEILFLQRAQRLSQLSDDNWIKVLRRNQSLGEGGNLPGTIVARRQSLYLCAVGYPDGEREDGSPYWRADPEKWALVHIRQPIKYDSYEIDFSRSFAPVETDIMFPAEPDITTLTETERLRAQVEDLQDTVNALEERVAHLKSEWKPENEDGFFRRARRLSGLNYDDWRTVLGRNQILGEGGNLPGGIVAQHDNCYLCTVGYPDGEREDGSPYWGPDPEKWALVYILQPIEHGV